MKKGKDSTRIILGMLVVIFIILIIFFFKNSQENKYNNMEQLEQLGKLEKINGVILLSENTGDISGYYQWEKELDEQGLRAIIKPERVVMEKYPDYFKQLSDKGYEVATGYGKEPFWNMSYEDQYNIMKEYKEYHESVTQKPLKIFSSKYFAYDENTLKAADALGIPYILARGTGIEAAIYSPIEYNAKLIFVSNLVFEEMGSGSLCDSSLYERGATADEFTETLEETFNQDLKDIVLVSHVYIGGTRVEWWNAYKGAIDSQRVSWKGFDDWANSVKKVQKNYDQIPYNTEVKYLVPKPSIPLDQLELLPALKAKNKVVVFHNGQGEMCLEFLEFIETIDYPLEEHLTTETGFYQTLESYKKNFDSSEGYSTSFGYYPIIFIEDRAYSGFDSTTKQLILNQIQN